MASKRVGNEGRKFVSLLASRLKKENCEFYDAELDTLFGDAVSNLPDSELKSDLTKYHEEHLKKIKSLLSSKKSQKESAAEKHTKFNFYKEHNIDKIINKAKASKSIREKDHLLKCIWSCYPLLKDSQKIVSSLEETDGLAAVEECIHRTIGCFDKKNILECLGFLLRVFSTQCEACLTATQSSKCIYNVSTAMQKSIMVMNHRWISCRDMSSTNAQSQDELYKDLVAAMLSLWTDLMLLSSHESNDGSVIEHIASLVFTVIGHSPEHCMDTMLQLTKPNERLVSLIRRILERNKGQLTHKQYIKFICLTRLALKLCTTTDNRMSILKIADNQRAPPGFVPFLLQLNKSLVERLTVTKKMSSSQLTAHLLVDLCEDDTETLLDIATENPNKDVFAEDDEETEVEPDDPTCDNQLFFIDSLGGVEDIEDNVVEVEENKTRDAMLRKQIKTMIREAEEESASEDEDMFNEPLLPNIAKELDEPADKDENEETKLSLKVHQGGDISAEKEDVGKKAQDLQPLRRSTRKSKKKLE